MTEEQFSPKMSLPVAIGALKELNEWLKIYYRVQAMDGIAALDVVIAEVEKPTYTKDRIIEILVTTKALTEHLSQDERNEFFEKSIKYWEATE